MNLDFDLTGHNDYCPMCKTHLTSLYLCPECGVRFDGWHKAEALAASRLESLNVWKEAAKEKRWRLILCTEAAASRLELLRECNNIMPTCPKCKGNLKTWSKIDENKTIRVGHNDGCKLAEELGDD